ncbi:MAG: ADP-dependent NAD(P)H-hydrate dehydratase / NAD(P)H-hydrate epimerase [Candidatus Atribacteria bacterium]|nr:ADP-dependent NAD(P)H-hydrate dehydratase / NAD(P)H-hydrate epimerase [Candidatus Atribacteria bacterium]
MKLVSAELMQKIEKELVEKYDIPTLLLMENAGRGVAAKAAQLVQEQSIEQVYIICGVGNNGGDGLAVARHLRLTFPRLPIVVYLLGEITSSKPDAWANLQIVEKLGNITVKQIILSEEMVLDPAGLVIDAIFGIGLSREVGGRYREVIERINSSPRQLVLSIDIPSGLDATTGQVLGCAVKADFTVTLGLAKRGLFVYPGRDFAGKISVASIGIPLIVRDQPGRSWLIEPELIKKLLPLRGTHTHKISAGVVGVISGSSALLGAGMLVALGAYKSGAGMVVWPLPAEVANLVKVRIPEVVSPLLPAVAPEWEYSSSHWEELKQILTQRKCNSLAVGPGLGLKAETAALLRLLVEQPELKGVLDADGLNLVAQEREDWKDRLSGWVITPHPGEMARLLQWTPQKVNDNRVEAVFEAARFFGSTTVLKGPGTLVATPEGELWVNPTGDPALATAGSGDVLTGMIAAFMAQGLSPRDSALVGVFLHGLTGELTGKTVKDGVLASELPEVITEAKRMLLNGKYRISFMDGN